MDLNRQIVRRASSLSLLFHRGRGDSPSAALRLLLPLPSFVCIALYIAGSSDPQLFLPITFSFAFYMSFDDFQSKSRSSPAALKQTKKSLPFLSSPVQKKIDVYAAPESFESIRKILNPKQFSLASVSDYGETERPKADLILVDLRTPVNGKSVQELLAKTKPPDGGTPVLFLTTSIFPELQKRVSGEFHDFIVAPFQEEELSDRIVNLLQLAEKNKVLKNHSEKLEIILEGTQHITMLRDPVTAATLTCAYLRKILGVENTTLKCFFLPKSLVKLTDAYVRYVPMKGLTILPDDKSDQVQRIFEDHVIHEVKKISLTETGDLWIPIRNDDRQLALLIFGGLNGESVFMNLEFIESMANSLSLVLANIRHTDQSRLAQIGQMASGIIHDLKNYMISIRNSARLLLDDSLNEKDKRVFSDIIQSESEQLLEMAKDILDFSRSEITVFPIPVKLRKYMGEISQFLHPMFREKQMNCSIAEIPDITFYFDPAKFKRVIYNIGQNAQKAMSPGGDFRVEVAATENGITFIFKDTGKGIPIEIIDSFFEPFVTGDANQGTGLGMTITKGIVEAHGGTIRYETGSDGTTFYIDLPAIKP